MFQFICNVVKCENCGGLIENNERFKCDLDSKVWGCVCVFRVGDDVDSVSAVQSSSCVNFPSCLPVFALLLALHVQS